jgi:hypothetical protein
LGPLVGWRFGWSEFGELAGARGWGKAGIGSLTTRGSIPRLGQFGDVAGEGARWHTAAAGAAVGNTMRSGPMLANMRGLELECDAVEALEG